MSQITAPVILDSTGQNIVTQLAAISAALAAGLPVPASTVPLMDGAGAVGTGLAFAREDHVHPSDTTRVPTSRTVNGKALSADIALTAADVGAATPQQLAYVETGTTASQNYSAGQYICWNGLLYTADTNISTGTTLSASGGNKNLTECVGGGLNALRIQKTTVTAPTSTGSGGRVYKAVPVPSGKIVVPLAWFSRHNTSPASFCYGPGEIPNTYVYIYDTANGLRLQFDDSGFVNSFGGQTVTLMYMLV